MLCFMIVHAPSCHLEQTSEPAKAGCANPAGRHGAVLTTGTRMPATGGRRHGPNPLSKAWTEVAGALGPGPEEATLSLAVEAAQMAFQAPASRKLHGAKRAGPRSQEREKEALFLDSRTSPCLEGVAPVNGATSRQRIDDYCTLRLGFMLRFARACSIPRVPRYLQLEIRAVVAEPAQTRAPSAMVPTQHVEKLDSRRDPVSPWLAISNAPVCCRVNRNACCSGVLWSGCGSLHGLRNAMADTALDELPYSAENAISTYPTPGRTMLLLTT